MLVGKEYYAKYFTHQQEKGGCTVIRQKNGVVVEEVKISMLGGWTLNKYSSPATTRGVFETACRKGAKKRYFQATFTFENSPS